ncbi:hypothetical protein Taro_007794 [Colocasia esculenta]|uniref:Retrotransposon gag domain-containing protein n=1 Tax=Colocasia esculenta TaxID=4460 RepID=A0A843U506_COLES|nr:hypothetical protein [Colocasia esculenta]
MSPPVGLSRAESTWMRRVDSHRLSLTAAAAGAPRRVAADHCRRRRTAAPSSLSLFSSLSSLRNMAYQEYEEQEVEQTINPGWAHGTLLDARQKKVKCNWCSKEMFGAWFCTAERIGSIRPHRSESTPARKHDPPGSAVRQGIDRIRLDPARFARPDPLRFAPPRTLKSRLFFGAVCGNDVAMARGRTSYQNVGSRATRSRHSRAESLQRSPPIDVNIAPVGANNNDVPAPAIAAPATAMEMAELRGQMQQLTGVCLALQAQLVGPPAPAVPLPRERQAESSHRHSRVLPAPQDQQADSLRRSHRAPSEERASERRGRSPRRSVVSPCPPRSVVGANSHGSGRGGPANSEQELARRLRRVVDLERRVDAMVQRAEGKAPAEDDLDFRSPFSREILEARVSPKLPLPTIAPYDGTSDPADHIYGFESHIVFHGASDAAKCRAFPATLKETARAWFETLPAGSISSFRQLKKSFQDNFLGGRREGTRDGFLQRTLGVQQPATFAELISIAQRHAACEESLAAGRAEQGEQSDKKRPSDNGSDRDRKKGRRNGDSPRRPRPFTDYTPLTVAPEQILAEIKNEAYVRWPQRMRSDPQRCDQNKYCRFHRDHGHDTSECRQLKDEIEDLIKRSYLGRFVRRNEDRPRRRERTPEQPINNEPNGQEINVIAGGFGAGGESTRSRRDYARRVHVVDRPSAPRSAPYPTSPARAPPEEAITFSDEDLVGVTTPHADALVISAIINHCNVRRILVDNGSAPDVLAYDCFVLMGLKTDQLAPVNSPLFGFLGVSVQPMGRVRLPITLGTAPRIVTKVVDFLVINNMPGYNAILGRGLIGRIKAVPSSLHQKMKFPTPSGVGEVLRSNPANDRSALHQPRNAC